MLDLFALGKGQGVVDLLALDLLLERVTVSPLAVLLYDGLELWKEEGKDGTNVGGGVCCVLGLVGVSGVWVINHNSRRQW